MITWIFVLSALVATAAGDYSGSLDYPRCRQLTQPCKARVSNIEDILAGPGITSMVSGGRLNMDCSPRNVQSIRACRVETRDICWSDQDRDLEKWVAVYLYLCSNRQTLLDGADCTASGHPAQAIMDCVMETDDQEVKCRREPRCVQGRILQSTQCDGNMARLFLGMLMTKFNTHMDHCRQRIE